jgi:hypothetical protein
MHGGSFTGVRSWRCSGVHLRGFVDEGSLTECTRLGPGLFKVGARLFVGVVFAVTLAATIAVGQPRPAAPVKPGDSRVARIAFVPLDDRPRSSGDVVRLAAAADVEVVTPPAGLLSRHLKTGDGDGLARWLDGLDATAVDAVVISTDMLAYGGLLGSRSGRVFEPDARRRLDAIDRLKSRRAGLPVLAFTSLLRQAPTDDGGNPGWRGAVTSWARYSAANDDPEAASRTTAALDALPAGMLDAYKATRARNVAVALSMIERAAMGTVDVLVFGDDEPLDVGVQVEERARLAAAIAGSAARNRIEIREGADEAAALLMARAVVGRSKAPPTVRVNYSSDDARRRTGAAVAADLRIAGAREAPAKGAATVTLEVFASGESAPAEALARRVLAPGALVAIADVGDGAQGGSLGLLETLRSSRAYTRLAGFAAGPTPQAAIATALVQALAIASVVDRPAAARPREVLDRVAAAHARQLLGAAIEDVLFREVISPQAREDLLAPRNVDPMAIPEKERPRLSTYIEKELTPLAQSLVGDFGIRPWPLPSRSAKPPAPGIVVKDIERLVVSFPWGEMSEPEFTFDLVVEPVVNVPRPPAPKILPRR